MKCALLALAVTAFLAACGARPAPTLDALATQVAQARADAAVLTASVPTPTSTTLSAGPSARPAHTNAPEANPTLAPGTTRTRTRDGTVMVYVPAGEFTMGSPEGEGQPNERPQHQVTLDAFWIDRTEAINAQYRGCVQAGACAEPGCVGHVGYGADDEPVTCVSWVDAVAYCEWAGARLPSEAEWEKAARGTDARVYPWGNQEPDATRANFDNGGGGPSAVGSYPSGASPYGALDMAGNVWEWVNDWFGNYGATLSDRNPQGPVAGTSKVVRGGAWPGSQVRAAGRAGFYPDESRKDCAACNNWGPEAPVCSCSRQDDIGFRCAASPGE